MRRTLTILLAFVGTACEAPPAAPADTAAPVEPSEPVSPSPGMRAPPLGWEDPDPAGTPQEPLPAVHQAVPPGFPPEDAYSSHTEACVAVVRAEVPPKWRRAVLAWCEHRSFAASRYERVVSRVDGSQIHDRDRPTAWMFWANGMARGHLDSECPFHRVNEALKHTKGCVKLQRHWPFNDVRLTERIATGWRKHPHDMERFGARGPHDWNANAFIVIPGCWAPQQLERFDVSVTTTVRGALCICETYGCSDKWAIKKHWRGGWAKCEYGADADD